MSTTATDRAAQRQSQHASIDNLRPESYASVVRHANDPGRRSEAQRDCGLTTLLRAPRDVTSGPSKRDPVANSTTSSIVSVPKLSETIWRYERGARDRAAAGREAR